MVTAVVPVCAGNWLEVVTTWLPKTGLMNGVVAEPNPKEGAVDTATGVGVAGWPNTIVPVVFAIGATVSTDEGPCPNTASVQATGGAAPGSAGTDGD